GDGYHDGYNDGFDDGFAAGFAAASGVPGGVVIPPPPPGGHRCGFSVVARSNFGASNINSGCERNVSGSDLFARAYQGNRYNTYPGSANLADSRRWVNERMGSPIATTTLRDYGSAGIRAAAPVNPVPSVYRDVALGARASERLSTPIAVGSVVRPG